MKWSRPTSGTPSLDGHEQILPFFVSRLMASKVSFVKLCGNEKLEALLDATVSALSFSGGVPAKMMFDNTGVLVRKILGGGKADPDAGVPGAAGALRLRDGLCNPGRGNEKGGAENLVQWAQRNLFSPVPRAASLAELNQLLQEHCLHDA